jgi:putative DNA primase/helicase
MVVGRIAEIDPGTQDPLACARAYRAAGLSIPPVRRDGSKAPDVPSWKRYQAEPPSAGQVSQWFDRPDPPGIAVIAGEVSGRLEMIDFDDATLLKPWRTLVECEAPGLLTRLALVRTPRPGFQVAYRCPEVKIPGSQKLAQAEDGKTLIETRGEGVTS